MPTPRTRDEYDVLLYVARVGPCDVADHRTADHLCRGDDAVLWRSPSGYDVSSEGWNEIDRMRRRPHLDGLASETRSWLDEVRTGCSEASGRCGARTVQTTIARAATPTGTSVRGSVDPEGSSLSLLRRAAERFADDAVEVVEGRECNRCGEWQPSAGFSANPSGKNGLRSTCRACDTAARRARRRAKRT